MQITLVDLWQWLLGPGGAVLLLLMFVYFTFTEKIVSGTRLRDQEKETEYWRTIALRNIDTLQDSVGVARDSVSLVRRK